MAVLLVDLDGTLVRNVGRSVKREAFGLALAEVAWRQGRCMDWREIAARAFEEPTDTANLAVALDQLGLDASGLEHALERTEACYRQRVTCCGANVIALPGVTHTLRSLRARGVDVVVASGSLAAVGEAKLAAAGLTEWVTCAHWATSTTRSRAEILAGARERHGGVLACVGDRVVEETAARGAGMEFLAVGTGGHAASEFVSPWVPSFGLARAVELLGL